MGVVTHLRRRWLVDARFSVCQKGWIRLRLLMGNFLHRRVYVKSGHQVDRDFFLDKRVRVPGLCIKVMHTANRNYSTKFTSYNIDQTEVSRSATKCRYNYDGGGHDQSRMP